MSIAFDIYHNHRSYILCRRGFAAFHFHMTLASIFLVVAAFSSNSPYAQVGAERELLRMMAYEPMVLLTAIGFYMVNGSFNVSDVVTSDVMGIVYLPEVYF